MSARLVTIHCNVANVTPPNRRIRRNVVVCCKPHRIPRPYYASPRQSLCGLTYKRLTCVVHSTVVEAAEESDYDLLSKRVEELSSELQDSLHGTNIYIVGLMGTGKSTVGRMLSYCLKYCFFDTDEVIEKYHDGKKVASIFEEEGEEYFRTCETEVLKQLSPYKRCVISTGGGIVEKPENWSYLQHGVVVWLDGPPELLALRVVSDGPQTRPLLTGIATATSNDSALEATAAKLASIMEKRKAKYANADLVVPLLGTGLDAERGAPPPVVNFRVMDALSKKIKETAKERADRANFTIEGRDNLPATMKVRPSATAQDMQ